MCRELLIKTVQETADIDHLGINWILQLLERIERQLDLRKGKVEHVPLIHDPWVLRLYQVRTVLQPVITLALEVVIERKDIPRLNVLNIKTQEFEPLSGGLLLGLLFGDFDFCKAHVLISSVEVSGRFLVGDRAALLHEEGIAVGPGVCVVVTLDSKVAGAHAALLALGLLYRTYTYDTIIQTFITGLVHITITLPSYPHTKLLRSIPPITHPLQIEHLNHLTRHLLLLPTPCIPDLCRTFWNNRNGISIQPAVQSTLYNLAVLNRVLF